MTNPTLRQVRRQVTLAGGNVAFEVTTQVTDSGDLPFPHLFVVNLGADLDPRSDVIARIATPVDLRRADPVAPIYVRVSSTDLIRISSESFARIGNINDITQLPRDRVVAQRRGFSQYLTSAISVIYNNLTTADAAARQIVDRLSALVTEWRSFNSTFATDPYQDYDLPAASISVESARTAVYVASRNARIAAEATRDAAALASAACVRDGTAERTIYNFLARDVAFLDQAAALVTAQVNDTYVGPPISPAPTAPAGPFTVTIASSRIRDFVLSPSTPTSYAALLVQKRAELETYSAALVARAARCDALAATLREEERAVADAQLVERAALAGVVAVCPTFDPSTV